MGNGPSTELSNSVNNLSGHIWNQTAQQNSQLNNPNYQSINNFTLTDPINSIAPINLQQQQQMERVRLTNIMNQGKNNPTLKNIKLNIIFNFFFFRNACFVALWYCHISIPHVASS